MLIGFNTGDYQATDLSMWMAISPSFCWRIISISRRRCSTRFQRERTFISHRMGKGQREVK